MSNVKGIAQSALHGFLDRCAGAAGVAADRITVWENSTEEVIDSLQNKKPIKVFAQGGRMGGVATGAKARLEENYLFDTRRFATGALTAGDYQFFLNAVGLPGVNNGFPAGLTMTELETNMDVAGQIAQGKNFVFNQIGITFNANIGNVDAGTLLESGALRFEKQGGQYTLRHGPIKFWPGGMGIGGYAGTVAVAASSNGVQDIRSVRKLAIPRVIREKESFAYKYLVTRSVSNLDNTTAITLGANCIMSVWLWGGQQDAIPV